MSFCLHLIILASFYGLSFLSFTRHFHSLEVCRIRDIDSFPSFNMKISFSFYLLHFSHPVLFSLLLPRVELSLSVSLLFFFFFSQPFESCWEEKLTPSGKFWSAAIGELSKTISTSSTIERSYGEKVRMGKSRKTLIKICKLP